MKIVAFAGGVGGARLTYGFAQILPPDDFTVVVNTGDDFEHYGLHICPDLDTVCYTLAGLASQATGWGRESETWNAIANARQVGGPDWFKLGDKDLGTHLERTRRLSRGDRLSDITRDFCRAWSIRHQVLPMSDQAVRTIVRTAEQGELPFQDYFVRLQCQPTVLGFHFTGIESATPAPGVLQAIRAADAIVICPSNPWVSIDPILSLTGIQPAIKEKIVVAVSPIIAGKAVKGPVTKMYAELGITPSAKAVADHYRPFLKGFVLDIQDKDQVDELMVPALTTDTLMSSLTKRTVLAKDVLHFIGRLQPL